MFGYVMPLKGELKIREYEVFKAYYCGLCREIGSKSYISKLTLTYDMTFLALLLSSVYAEQELAQKAFCPFKAKRIMAVNSSSIMEYAADMNILLSSRKLKDNYNDDKNFLSLIASKVVNTRKLSDIARDKVNKIDKCLNELSRLEKEKCSSIDETAHYFAETVSEIFSIYDDKNDRILGVLGYNIGKWIYTLDAYDDLLEDIKRGSYNPLIYRFDYKGENPWEFRNSIRDNMQFVLIRCLDEISKAFELLNVKRNKGILENIIYMGMERKTAAVIGIAGKAENCAKAGGKCRNEKSI